MPISGNSGKSHTPGFFFNILFKFRGRALPLLWAGKKDEFKNFPIPKGIYFAPVDYDSGNKSNFDQKNSIIEAFKTKDINNISNKNLSDKQEYDTLRKFNKFY